MTPYPGNFPIAEAQSLITIIAHGGAVTDAPKLAKDAWEIAGYGLGVTLGEPGNKILARGDDVEAMYRRGPVPYAAAPVANPLAPPRDPQPGADPAHLTVQSTMPPSQNPQGSPSAGTYGPQPNPPATARGPAPNFNLANASRVQVASYAELQTHLQAAVDQAQAHHEGGEHAEMMAFDWAGLIKKILPGILDILQKLLTA